MYINRLGDRDRWIKNHTDTTYNLRMKTENYPNSCAVYGQVLILLCAVYGCVVYGRVVLFTVECAFYGLYIQLRLELFNS